MFELGIESSAADTELALVVLSPYMLCVFQVAYLRCGFSCCDRSIPTS
jgi:hypothetical protein